MVRGLTVTLSRSAFTGLLAGVCSLLYVRRARIGVLVGLALLISQTFTCGSRSGRSGCKLAQRFWSLLSRNRVLCHHSFITH